MEYREDSGTKDENSDTFANRSLTFAEKREALESANRLLYICCGQQ